MTDDQDNGEVRAHLIVTGVVQGVGFRGFTMTNASRLGLSGWVRNLPNRTVEAVVEGRKDLIDSLIRQLKDGPPAAVVKSVDISWQPTTGEFVRFNIKL